MVKRAAYAACAVVVCMTTSPAAEPSPTDSVAVALRSGRYDVALRAILAAYNGTPANSSPTDQIRLALCLMHLDDPARADSLFAQARMSGFQVGYRDYWRAYSQHLAGHARDAATRFDAVSRVYHAPLSDSALVWALRCAMMAGDERVARRSIERLVDRSDDLAAVGWLARMQTDPERREMAWHALLIDHARTPEAYDAALLVDSLGWPMSGDELLALAHLYERHGDIDRAVQVWYRALDDSLLQSQPTDVRYQLAETLLRRRSYSEAARHLDTLLSDAEANEWVPAIMRLYAKLERTRNRESRSRYWESRFVDEFPSHEDVPEALWNIGMSWERVRRCDRAIEVYERLTDEFKGHTFADQASWRIGLCHYKSKRYSRAHRQFSRLAGDTKNFIMQDQAGYWAGRALFADGQYERAHDQWDRVAAYSPRTYYAVVSALVVDRPIVPPEDEQPEQQRSGRVPSEWPGFDEAYWLASVGEWRWARAVLSFSTRGQARTMNAMDDLADAFEATRDYSMALRWRWRAMWRRITEDRYHELPPDILRRVWPDFFRDEVLAAAQAASVEPALLWAVIRQESVFDPDARSRADARGLMQITPATGRALADQARLDNFDPDQLFDPVLNTRLGARYVASLLRRFDGKVDYVVAGYNAGPSNVTRWRRSAGEDHDLFREMITYSETRKYVKLVLKNYLIYRSLYPNMRRDD